MIQQDTTAAMNLMLCNKLQQQNSGFEHVMSYQKTCTKIKAGIYIPSWEALFCRLKKKYIYI